MFLFCEDVIDKPQSKLKRLFACLHELVLDLVIFSSLTVVQVLTISRLMTAVTVHDLYSRRLGVCKKGEKGIARVNKHILPTQTVERKNFVWKHI